MVTFQAPGATLEADASASGTPLIVLYERDDAIAVPLLSQLRLASYDVRAARTPVELFDILSKHITSLVLVDLGNATAGRREFWVALDAHRRGRNIQVMTFRFNPQDTLYDADFEPAGRALADVEVQGAQEFQRVIEGVRQRIAPQGGGFVSGPHAFGMAGMAGIAPASSYPGGIAPIGAALGVPSPYMYGMGGMGASYGPAPYPQQMPSPVPHQDPAGYGYPFAQPFGGPLSNPFAASAPGFMAPGAPYSPPPGAPFSPPPSYSPPPYSPLPPESGPFPFAPQFQPQSGFVIPNGPPAPSPFARPFDGNSYPPAIEQSPFAQPYSANPFADLAAESGSPQPGPSNPFVGSPWGASAPGAGASAPGHSPYDLWNDGNARAIMPPSAALANSPAAAGFSAPAQPQPGAFGMSSAGFSPFGSDALRQPGREPEQAPAFSDVWTPPDGGLDGETGVVPEMAHKPISNDRASWARPDSRSFDARPPSAGLLDPRVADAPPGSSSFSSSPSDERSALGSLVTQQPTAPVPTPSRLPAVISENPADRALGTVLVEGSLLSPNRLEVLKGIQQMLATVDMSFKLGELALLFKFLSPDQLLAALLVSRGLVSPQQIAGLGRVKQELAGSGMDYDLEALLIMFHILPIEQLQQLRDELAG